MDISEAVWESNMDCGHDIKKIGCRILLIVGPSGSGKTAISVELENISKDIKIIPNNTTRPPRLNDPIGHFNYLNKEEFFKNIKGRRFFLARISPFPQYAYTIDDVNSAINLNKFAVFLFRNSGLKFVYGLLNFAFVVFIEPVASYSSKRSLDELTAHSEEETLKVMDENANLLRICREKGWPCFCLKNNYQGDEEIKMHAYAILKWMKQYDIDQ